MTLRPLRSLRSVCCGSAATPHPLPSRWEALSTRQYLRLVEDLMLLAEGKLSPGTVRLRLLCDTMGWDLGKMKGDDTLANAIMLSEHITFPLRITYPEEANELLHPLPRDIREQCRRTDPFRLHLPIATKLQQMDYRYTIDLCFCKQFLPTLRTRHNAYQGYIVSTAYDTLTLSLTSLQYIEAMAILKRIGANGANGQTPSTPTTLPLLAAILYTPQPYSSTAAHAIADDLATLPPPTLQAVAWNFQALNNFIFTHTPFSLLAHVQERRSPPIATDAGDALYDLSADGLGNNTEIEQMNIITYLRILRKKTIDTVRLMRTHQIGTPQISAHTGLPIHTVNQILGIP